jgi:hypothetical protein
VCGINRHQRSNSDELDGSIRCSREEMEQRLDPDLEVSSAVPFIAFPQNFVPSFLSSTLREA